MGVPLSYNLRNLVERKVTTLMTALGIGMTVAVLVATFSMVAGLQEMFAQSGDPRNVIVLRKGSDSELISGVSQEVYQTVRSLGGAGGVALNAKGEPLVAPEGMTVVNLPSKDNPDGTNLSVRGILPVTLEIREVEIVAGKMIEPGKRQVVVGEALSKRYADARLGSQIRFGRGMWEVVGVFRAKSNASNSEIWADLNQLRGDTDSGGGSNSILVRTESEAAATDLIKKIGDDQRLQAQGLSEREYYDKQTRSGAFLKTMGFAVAIIMAVGSAFAATNTMYAAVSRRRREIGVLRAIGFGRGAVLRSFVLESVALALVGGVAGVLIALPMNGFATGVGTSNFSETAFTFKVSAGAIVAGLVFAAGIGLVGGFLPAWSASRLNVIQAMKDA